jgi:protein SCO1/2
MRPERRSPALTLARPSGGLDFNGPTIKNPTVPLLFALHDQDGQRVGLAGQRGPVVLLTFLYIHCPDVCPLVAGNLNVTLRALGPRRRHVRVLAITVDPAGESTND